MNWLILFGKIGYKFSLFVMIVFMYINIYTLTEGQILGCFSLGLLFSIISSIPYNKDNW